MGAALNDTLPTTQNQHKPMSHFPYFNLPMVADKLETILQLLSQQYNCFNRWHDWFVSTPYLWVCFTPFIESLLCARYNMRLLTCIVSILTTTYYGSFMTIPSLHMGNGGMQRLSNSVCWGRSCKAGIKAWLSDFKTMFVTTTSLC